MTDPGFISAAGVEITNPLPPSWVGRVDSPSLPPVWARIGRMSNYQIQYLQAQIAYDASGWDYARVGANHELGLYQITPQQLERYGLLASGSYAHYGEDCVNYKNCWQPVYLRNTVNTYENYFYTATSQDEFIKNIILQDHLAYQILNDLPDALFANESITAADPVDIVAGMVYVGWSLGPGSAADTSNPAGTGAYAWRFYNQGNGINSFNSGRYAVISIGQ